MRRTRGAPGRRTLTSFPGKKQVIRSRRERGKIRNSRALKVIGWRRSQPGCRRRALAMFWLDSSRSLALQRTPLNASISSLFHARSCRSQSCRCLSCSGVASAESFLTPPAELRIISYPPLSGEPNGSWIVQVYQYCTISAYVLCVLCLSASLIGF